MRPGNFLLINEKTVLRYLTAEAANRLTHQSYVTLGSSKLQLPSKIYLNVPQGDFRAMPAYAPIKGGISGIKWVSVFTANPKRGLPVVIGTMLLNDSRTGRCLAVIEANALTAYRTGAAGAVASKAMANASSRVLALVGSGVQSEYQLRCHRAYYDFDEVRVWSPRLVDALRFARRFKRIARRIIPFKNLQSCVHNADIISTCTPSRRPLLRMNWIKKGAHINAIGADAKGKVELHSRLVKHARVFVDNWQQASHSGEINVHLRRKVISARHIRGTLTEILMHKKRARLSTRDITIFDSTGLAIQDLLLAHYVYSKCRRHR